MSEINYNIGLCGEYRLTVLDNKTVVSDTGWCKNTILSGGLAYLATSSILGGLSYVDFGTSNLYSGEYNLTGVLTPSINTELVNVSSNNIQYYSLNSSTQVYYATFSTKNASNNSETLNEFCIKTGNQIGFSRTVLPDPVGVSIGQNVNFEYRVSVDYSNEHQSNVEFVTYSGNSFYIPVTSKSYNLPNFDNDITSVGKLIDTYPLYLLQNNDELPSFGSNYPQERIYGINDSQTQSKFYPSIVYSALDNSTKTYSVITEYNNLSAPIDTGVFSNINTALLTYKDSGFYASRFAFPLALYNTSLYASNTAVNSSNLMALYYKYTWGETLSSTFTTPTTFTLSAPQLFACNINQFVDLYPNSFINLYSNSFTTANTNGNTTRIRVNLLGTDVFNAIDFNYFTPQIDRDVFEFGPSPYRIVVYDSIGEVLRDTGYVFPNINQAWNYNNTPTTSLNYYNTELLALANQSITGSTSGTTTLTNLSVYPGSDYVDVVINSPFIGTSWELILDTTRPVIVPVSLPPLDCFALYNFIDNVGVYDYTYQLEPTGGIIILDFTSDNVDNIPNKLEIIHNNIKVSTTGIAAANTGPYDNVYGTNLTPTLAQALSTDQFISTAKSPPSRYDEFVYETSITDITPTGQQLLWWQYTSEDYTNSSAITARFTSPDTIISSTNEFRVKRLCTNQTPIPPSIPCNEITTSGGAGITEEALLLSPSGGIVIIDFGAQGVPDKLELIHNNSKVATSGMTTPNNGPFDNIYGDPVVPTVAETLMVDQFIGTNKGAIPSREQEFFNETSITDITRTYQQLIWWVYTPADCTVSNTLTARVTGPSGTGWDFARRCTNQIPGPPPPSGIVIYPLFNVLNNIITDDGSITSSVVSPNFYGYNNVSVDDGLFTTRVISPSLYGYNNVSVDDGLFTARVISPSFYGYNNVSVDDGSLTSSVISPSFYGYDTVSVDDGVFTA